ncbi:MAG: cytochrome c oxidase accessory protein CcoG [Candidatus Cloacimonetes bacterium]|jgi:cytochrome c oxidase accessory protein FixG|nr:cytochrome c oxidase accessory protein CcoG [Candidatus Cloacimonadota bacterium]
MLGFAGTRNWVYLQHIDGAFQRLRRRTFLVLHLILFGLPWLHVGGTPALLLDLPARRLYAFGAIYTATDTVLLLLVLLFLAFSLFFFTSLFGRLWCGYACPQTVFLDAWVRPIERWIEGERTTRIRRDKGGWTWDRIWRKAAKWSLFALAAFVISMTFASYFTPANVLWTGQASAVSYGLVAFFAGAWFLDFTWFREQFCNYLCPYARFQSAMTDDNTLIIAYDPARGDPRGGKTAKLEGRCIECSKCVTGCPQGIDIRNGFQLECITCARCIDACTDVMGRFGHESLIQYTSLAKLAGRKQRFWRPRTVAYAAILSTILLTGAVLVNVRVPFEASVARAPGSLYTIDEDGFVRNTFLLRVANNRPDEPLSFAVTVEGIEQAEVVAPSFELAPEEGRIVPLVVRVPVEAAAARTLPMRVNVDAGTSARTLTTTFKTAGEGVGP